MYACVHVHICEDMYVENRGQTQVLFTSVFESGFLTVQKLNNSSKDRLAPEPQRSICLFKLITSCYSNGVLVFNYTYVSHTLVLPIV